MKTFLMRSLLFVPGHNEKFLASASKSIADVLLLDIEDSVQPAPINKSPAIPFCVGFKAGHLQIIKFLLALTIVKAATY